MAYEEITTARIAADGRDAAETSMAVTVQERYEMVAVAAYFRAEHRGFAPGGAVQDWLEAEQDIDRLLAGMASGSATGGDDTRLRNALRLWN